MEGKQGDCGRCIEVLGRGSLTETRWLKGVLSGLSVRSDVCVGPHLGLLTDLTERHDADKNGFEDAVDGEGIEFLVKGSVKISISNFAFFNGNQASRTAALTGLFWRGERSLEKEEPELHRHAPP